MSLVGKKRLIISGRVQGVGYRRYAQLKATELQLLGWVRNLLDGSVELKCEGPLNILEEFIAHLKKGPPFAVVRDLIIEDITEEIGMEGFRVLPDGERK